MTKMPIQNRIACIFLSGIVLTGCSAHKYGSDYYAGQYGEIASGYSAVKVAQERTIQAEAQNVIAMSALAPEIALNASATSYIADDMTPQARTSAYDYGIGLTWPLLKSAAAIKGIQASQENVRAAKAALSAQENTLLSEIATSYGDHMRAKNVAALRQQQLSRLHQYLADQKRRKQAGNASGIDITQIEGRIARAKSQLANAQADLWSAQAKIKALGLDPQAQITLAHAPSYVPASEEDAVAAAKAANPNLRQSQHSLKSAQHEAWAGASELGPDLTFSLNSGQTGTIYADSSQQINNSTSLKLGLSVPLFDGGKRLAELSVKQSQVRELEFETAGTARDIEVQVRTLFHRYEATKRANGFAKQRIHAAKRTLDGTRQALKIGARTVNDELAAMDELTEAQVAFATSEFDLVNQGHQLMAALGNIAEAYNLHGGG